MAVTQIFFSRIIELFFIHFVARNSVIIANSACVPEWEDCSTNGWCCGSQWNCRTVNPDTGLAMQCLPDSTQDCSNKAYDTCGGNDFNGATCCPQGWTCVRDNEWHSQCRSSGRSSTTTTLSPTTTTLAPSPTTSSTTTTGTKLVTTTTRSVNTSTMAPSTSSLTSSAVLTTVKSTTKTQAGASLQSSATTSVRTDVAATPQPTTSSVAADVEPTTLASSSHIVFSKGKSKWSAISPKAVMGDPKSVIESLYPEMPNDTSLPEWHISNVLKECSHFSNHRLAPPNNGKPNPVHIAFAINRVVEVDDVKETMTADGVLFLEWDVTTCNKVAPYSVPAMDPKKLYAVSKDNVWVPDLLFTTSAVDTYMDSGFTDDMVSLVLKERNLDNYTLSFYHTRRGFFTSVCKLKLKKFPFDHQHCALTFALTAPLHQAMFHEVALVCSVEELSQWKVDGCSYQPDETIHHGNNVSAATFQLSLSRKPLYYLINLALPSLVLSLLEVANFLLPPQYFERPLFGVTIMLALTVAMSETLENVPKIAEPILLVDYIEMLSRFAAGCTLYKVVLSLLANSEDFKRLHNTVKLCGRLSISYIRLMDFIAFSCALISLCGINVYIGKSI